MIKKGPTRRQQEILDLLDQGYTLVPEIAARMDPPVSRNAVYEHGKRMRRDGLLPANFTFGGNPMREKQPGAEVLAELIGNNHEYSTRQDEHEARLALFDELRRTRDDLETVTRRLNLIIPH